MLATEGRIREQREGRHNGGPVELFLIAASVQVLVRDGTTTHETLDD